MLESLSNKELQSSCIKERFSCKNSKNFKVTSFAQHLQPATSIRCYFDKINLKESDFQNLKFFFKILVSNRKYNNNLKNREPRKKYLQFSYT